MFSNKVAIVTGGTSGTGKATVLKFIEHGASVAILDTNHTAGKELVKQISNMNGCANYYACNVSSKEEVKETIEKVVNDFGRLDYAYNNVGVGGECAKTHDYSVYDWDKVIALNLRGVFLCMKYEIPHILKQGTGAIVNCVSLLNTDSYEGDSAYVAAKSGVLALTKNIAAEYAKSGLRINSVSPGLANTPVINKGEEEKPNHIIATHFPERLSTPEEIAEAVIWLCSENASFAVGMNLVVGCGE